jgi:hypothetical protein
MTDQELKDLIAEAFGPAAKQNGKTKKKRSRKK